MIPQELNRVAKVDGVTGGDKLAVNKLKMRLQKPSDITVVEKIKITRFIEQHGLMSGEYVANEFFAYPDRDILTITDKGNDIKLIFSMQWIQYQGRSIIYWGDIVKKTHYRGINLPMLLFKYIYQKEGLFALFFKEKWYATCCYNPRIFDLTPKFLARYSVFDNNIDHPFYTQCLQVLGLEPAVCDGYFYDSSIKGLIAMEPVSRYKTNDNRINKFFYKNVLTKNEQEKLFYSGKSMVVVSRYNRKLIFKAIKLCCLNLINYWRKKLTAQSKKHG